MNKICSYCGGEGKIFSFTNSSSVNCERCKGTGRKSLEEQLEDIQDCVDRIEVVLEKLVDVIKNQIN